MISGAEGGLEGARKRVANGWVMGIPHQYINFCNLLLSPSLLTPEDSFSSFLAKKTFGSESITF